VFTGGVGENAAEIRARAVAGLPFPGLRLDPSANETGEGDRVIGPADDASSASILVVSSREDLEIARQVRSVFST
jgi:acetate kinase